MLKRYVAICSFLLLFCLVGVVLYFAYRSEPDLEYKPYPVSTTDRTYQKIPVRNDILDRMKKELVYNSRPFILDYEINNGFCVLNINAGIWNAMSQGEQKQIGDMLAASKAWPGRVINARLMVNRTEVGRIKPSLYGGHEFVLYRLTE